MVSELPFIPGMKIRLEPVYSQVPDDLQTVRQNLFCWCIVTNISGESFTIEPVNLQDINPSLFNTDKYEVKFIDRDAIFYFSTQVIKFLKTPQLELMMNFPEKVFSRPLRKFPRAKIDLLSNICFYKEQKVAKRDLIRARTVDLSVGGIKFIITEEPTSNFFKGWLAFPKGKTSSFFDAKVLEVNKYLSDSSSFLDHLGWIYEIRSKFLILHDSDRDEIELLVAEQLSKQKRR